MQNEELHTYSKNTKDSRVNDVDEICSTLLFEAEYDVRNMRDVVKACPSSELHIDSSVAPIFRFYGVPNELAGSPNKLNIESCKLSMTFSQN